MVGGVAMARNGARRARGAGASAVLAAVLAASLTNPAAAFRIELKDVAPDRIERQRAESLGQIPLPGTPNVAQFAERLKEKGLGVGNAMFIRVFKVESELEVWLQNGDRFELFATYPVCHWSGTLGPKISEGDKQTPEGVYTVSLRQIHQSGRHPKALNLGFPNLLDRQFQRTGSYILIHGGCGSVGCFAMTNPVIDEIHTLAQQALKNGQEALHVHVFPFRMTEHRLQTYALHEWYDFWRNLKDVHDVFERTKRPPKVTVCEGRYWVDPVGDGHGEVVSQGPLAVCGAATVAASSNAPTESASPSTDQGLFNPHPRPRQVQLLNLPPSPLPLRPRLDPPSPSRSQSQSARLAGLASQTTGLPLPTSTSSQIAVACNSKLASCKRWIALQTRVVAERRAAQARVATATGRATPRR